MSATSRMLLALLLLAACHTDAPRFSDCHVAADLLGPPMTAPDAAPSDASPGARTSPNGCDGLIASPIPPSTHWVDSQAATGACASPPPITSDVCTTAGEMYAACESHIVAFGACALEAGMQFCNGVTWTVLCHTDGDCPGGFGCQFPGSTGACQRRCHIDSDCAVCTLICGSDGLCGLPPGPPLIDASVPPPDASL